MSWIAPTIAAEMWGMSLDQVVLGIQNGSIPSKCEGGFVFVQHGEHFEAQAVRVPTAFAPEPTVASAIAAINEQQIAARAADPSDHADEHDESRDIDHANKNGTADHDYLNFLKHSGDWRRARREAEKLRHPPVNQEQAKAA